MDEFDDPLESYDPLTTTRFEKGRSGNPSGRPRGKKNVKTIVQKIAHEQHLVTFDGQRQKMSTVELLLHILQRKALQGDLAAARLLDKILEKYSPQEANSKGHGCLIAPEPIDLENSILEIEDIDIDEGAIQGGFPNPNAIKR